MNIVLASNNPGKIIEFSAALSKFKINLLPQSQFNVPEIEETGLSFIENAILKARHASEMTGLPALSDDSGLVVSALAGQPGIFSARFAGPKATALENNNKLLTELNGVTEEDRRASFHCVLAFILHSKDPTPLVVDGKWEGYILQKPRGALGFGYDPIFYIPALKKSAAELSLEEKNKMSHRGIAIQTFLKLFPEKMNESTIR